MEGINKTEEDAFTVSQLTGLIKTMLEGSFSNVVLKGEISNFKPSASGHLYFSLKDSNAQISAVMFRGSASYLNFKPKDGTFVLVKGKISVYEPRGNYQLIISSMIEAGVGNIMEMIEMRKRKLAAEGLFNSDKKKPLPFFPKTIGVVTSSNGAALRDIINIRNRRNPKVNIIVLPSLVQGDTAASSIEYMIKVANKYEICDALIIGRGGGSLEDLLPFSEENVVRAVAESKIPTVTAVGHEIDWALCDFASDKRAPTPSAAAEILIPELNVIQGNIEYFKDELLNGINAKINSTRLLLKTFDTENMRTRLQNIEQRLSERFDRAFESLEQLMKKIIEEKRHKVALCRQTIENCSPQTVFDRGYSMVCDKDGNVIRSADQVKSGDFIKIRPATGEFEAAVK
ncbi:MAG: exodeoxyribonuclease VII large subunit [Treponema sp.]|nr:exodeoxyribonuclease VII large subunit [Treponema sp.]